MSKTSTGFVYDEHFLQHDSGEYSVVTTRVDSYMLEPVPHPSSVVITARIKQLLDVVSLTALMQAVPARPATEGELTVYHTQEYIAGLRAYCSAGPAIGPWGEAEFENPLSPGSFEAALYAAGGAIEAVRAVMDGRAHNAYALLRPPGHHAMQKKAMGFCLFNNIAVAAHFARKTYGLERVMIVDWDVHHGNGTQDAFYADPHTLFVSLHQENWYPRLSGQLEQVGSGAGQGYNVNIPLPPGTGDRGYLAAFEQVVVPVGLSYKPQLILISAGQDASFMDPLAQMMVTMAGYRQLSQLMADLAEEVCAGRLVVLQEGGYSATYTPYCTAAVVEPLVGLDLGIVEPFSDWSEWERSQSILSKETLDALASAREWHRQWWKV